MLSGIQGVMARLRKSLGPSLPYMSVSITKKRCSRGSLHIGMPDMAYSAADTSRRRLKMSSRGEFLMERPYLASVESERKPILQCRFKCCEKEDNWWSGRPAQPRAQGLRIYTTAICWMIAMVLQAEWQIPDSSIAVSASYLGGLIVLW
jgi:hypothetical protein